MSIIIEVGTLVALVIVLWRALRHRHPAISLARVAAGVVGMYAALLGSVHGVYEILQGSTAPAELLIHAIGPPCQPDVEWHACLPAITVMPSFLVSGLCVLIVGLVMAVWATGYVQRQRGGVILIGLAIGLLLVGGGFFPMFYGIIAGVSGTRISSAKPPIPAH